MDNISKYNTISIGIDQSYKNTGISIIADGQIKDIKSARLDNYRCNTDRREALRVKLGRLLLAVDGKAENIVCIIERTRVHGGGRSFINVDAIKAMGSLSALIVDAMHPYGIKVYSVDTRSWKSQVVGTSKPEANIYGVQPAKWPTVRWLIDQDMEKYILTDITGSRRQKGVFKRDNKLYCYNDDAADSAGIGMFWFVGDHKMLKEER